MFALRPLTRPTRVARPARVRPAIIHPSTRIIPCRSIPVVLSPVQQQRCTMATAPTFTLPEWLVIVPDFPNALEKRLAIRPQHLADLQKDRVDMILWGGASLDEQVVPGDTSPPKSNGSVMLVGANTKEEVIERLKKDVYVTAGVWDLDRMQIMPFKTAIRKPL